MRPARGDGGWGSACPPAGAPVPRSPGDSGPGRALRAAAAMGNPRFGAFSVWLTRDSPRWSVLVAVPDKRGA